MNKGRHFCYFLVFNSFVTNKWPRCYDAHNHCRDQCSRKAHSIRQPGKTLVIEHQHRKHQLRGRHKDIARLHIGVIHNVENCGNQGPETKTQVAAGRIPNRFLSPESFLIAAGRTAANIASPAISARIRGNPRPYTLSRRLTTDWPGPARLAALVLGTMCPKAWSAYADHAASGAATRINPARSASILSLKSVPRKPQPLPKQQQAH